MNDLSPIITLKNVHRAFASGGAMLDVLKGIDLTISRGEMVAIVGASGSGKSTLMNVLGCLDRPTEGSYLVSGQETSQLDPDQLSQLRRNHFGFIFQRYHLLAELTALGNVEMPAIYSGTPPNIRKKRATALLERIGMGQRKNYRPSQLSGGQQQRVSIARALMNDAEVILADEPTGALDKHSSEEVLRILEELHAEGRTIIIVTHDMDIAKRAQRIIEISDGEIISDRAHQSENKTPDQNAETVDENKTYRNVGAVRAFMDRFGEAFRMALLSMNAHRMRTFLTMLGVIIGISAVVSTVALGAGTQKKILENISSLGSNTLNIFSGKSPADNHSGKITTLVEADAEALAAQPYAASATPSVGTRATIHNGFLEAKAMVSGVSASYFKTAGLKLLSGHFFDAESVRARTLDLVVDKKVVKTLFPNSHDSPVGKTILIGRVAARIVGVVESQSFGPPDELNIYLPYTSVQTRLLGRLTLNSIAVQIADNVDSRMAERAVTRFLTMRHGTTDFFIVNSEEFREQVIKNTQVLKLLVASIAAISLFVGGIGVMNIMLVTVSERINEIGVRMAVGARQSDILKQFLIESVLVCLFGGVVGVLFGLSVGWLFAVLGTPFQLVYSVESIVVAFLFSTLIGVCFGFFPARNASKLNPVDSLARD